MDATHLISMKSFSLSGKSETLKSQISDTVCARDVRQQLELLKKETLQTGVMSPSYPILLP